MKIFIPSKNRADTIRTHLCFEGEEYYILVHDEEQYDAYVMNDTIDPDSLTITDVPGDVYGLTRQREWAIDNLAEPGEWVVFADDNIRKIVALDEPWCWSDDVHAPKKYSSTWRKRYDHECTPGEFMQYARESIGYADAIGAHIVGFASTNNYYFRQKHWRTIGCVIGKLFLEHNVGVPYRHDISMEDYVHTAEHLLRYGRILINNFVFPVAKHYEPGGMGVYEERIAVRQRDCVMIMRDYPNLFRPSKLKWQVEGTDLELRRFSEERIEEWRQSMRRPVIDNVDRELP